MLQNSQIKKIDLHERGRGFFIYSSILHLPLTYVYVQLSSMFDRIKATLKITTHVYNMHFTTVIDILSLTYD